jgi:hypothetical protein
LAAARDGRKGEGGSDDVSHASLGGNRNASSAGHRERRNSGALASDSQKAASLRTIFQRRGDRESPIGRLKAGFRQQIQGHPGFICETLD